MELKAETVEQTERLPRQRRFSFSESGIQSEPSAYNGDMDPDQTETDESAYGSTLLKNRSSRTRSGNTARYSATAIQEQEEEEKALNHPSGVDFHGYIVDGDEGDREKHEIEQNDMLQDTTLQQTRNPLRASPRPINSISSRQMWNSSGAQSELDGDVESSVFGASSGSKALHYNPSVGIGKYGGLSSFELAADEEEYQHSINRHDHDRAALKRTENATADEEIAAENYEFDFVPLNRQKILANLPENLSNDWLESLPIITLNPDSRNYSDSKLESMVLDLKDRLEREEPAVEYKSLRQMKQTDFCSDGLNTNNRHKNRYRNILPYDKTRVRLLSMEDYINASHIDFQVGRQRLHYIATQGPLPATTADFWQMVWEQNVDVIAMLTREIEEGKVKCDRYWPELQDGHFYPGNLYRVTQLECHLLSSCVVRIFQMDDLERHSSRLVTHLNFTAWPDHNTPQDGIAVLEFIRLMHCVHNDGNHILVHCSAGVGRTGALLTIDICISMIENDLRFDLESVVRELRQQRHGMVQTQDQYRFCYTTILTLLENLQTEPV